MTDAPAPVPPAELGAPVPNCADLGRAHKWIALWVGGVWTDQRTCSTCGHTERMPTASEIARGES